MCCVTVVQLGINLIMLRLADLLENLYFVVLKQTGYQVDLTTSYISYGREHLVKVVLFSCLNCKPVTILN